ncbi:MAG: isoamylase early set domain-containing protein [Spirochaetaceae bacterium]|nr:isoamylase early set domain-containing protein [Spirochaetaceae bacterium]
MECGKAKAVVDAWERDGAIGARELKDLRAHIAACGECAAALGGLLPLLERDADVAAAAGATTPGPFVDSVMASLAALDGPAVSPLRASRPRVAFRAATAAAVFLVFAGAFALAVAKPWNDTVTVRLVLAAPEAESVSVAGDFNGWDPVGWEFSRARPDGAWELEVKLKKGAMYAYNFVIDGERWIPDPSTREFVEDGFGGESSLLRL